LKYLERLGTIETTPIRKSFANFINRYV